LRHRRRSGRQWRTAKAAKLTPQGKRLVALRAGHLCDHRSCRRAGRGRRGCFSRRSHWHGSRAPDRRRMQRLPTAGAHHGSGGIHVPARGATHITNCSLLIRFRAHVGSLSRRCLLARGLDPKRVSIAAKLLLGAVYCACLKTNVLPLPGPFFQYRAQVKRHQTGARKAGN